MHNCWVIVCHLYRVYFGGRGFMLGPRKWLLQLHQPQSFKLRQFRNADFRSGVPALCAPAHIRIESHCTLLQSGTH